MKKLGVFILLVVLTILPLFAVGGYFGVKSGAIFSWNTVEGELLGFTGKSEYSAIDIPVDIEGATYFGDKHQFGIGYGFGFIIPLEKKVGENVIESEEDSTALVPKVTLQYRNVINENMAFEFGAGINYKIKSYKDSDNMPEFKLSTMNFIANSGMKFNFTDLVGIRVGVELSTPIYTEASVEAGSTEFSTDISITGVSVTPYAGIVLCY